MANIVRALLACIVLTFFLIALMGAASSGETPEQASSNKTPEAAPGPEDVPKLDPNLPDVKDAEVAENRRPTLRLAVDPPNPVIGGTPVFNSQGQECRCVVTAIGYDAEDGSMLEYAFESSGPINGIGGGWDSNREVYIPLTGEDPSVKGYYSSLIVRARDSQGAVSDPVLVYIRIMNPNHPDYTGEEDPITFYRAPESSTEKSGDLTSEKSTSGEKSMDLLNCLCRCQTPENSDFICRYNTTPYPEHLGGSDSCGDLKRGPCMCEALGCFRTTLPTSGECYDRCVEIYGSPSEKEASSSSTGDPATSGTDGSTKENEPNDQAGDATEIPLSSAVVEGRIAPAGDVDFYKFYEDSSGILTVEFQSLPPEMKARIALYGKNLNWIVNRDASNPGDLVTFKKDVVGPGWNYIAVSDIDRKAHSEDYTFKAVFDPAPDTNEPNNEAGDATYVETDETIGGYICPQDDLDIYKFYIENSGILKAKLDDAPEVMRARIALYGKNFNWIVNADASNAGDAITLERGIPGPGSYYVSISDIERKAYSEEYSLDLIFEEAPDEYEPNNEIGDATSLETNDTAIGYICPQDDVDFYEFYADNSGILKVNFNSVPEDMRVRIALYGKNFNWIVNTDASNAGDAISLEKDILGPGPFYIAISDIDRKAHSTEYSFDVVFDAAPDEGEPNNQVGYATGAEFGKTVVGYICPQDDLDIYAFYVDASGILEVALTDVPEDMKPRIGLFGKNFNWIVNKDATNAGDEITLEKDVAEAGIYYVAISDIDRKAYSESYTMMAILKAG
jgi:hypothetical protein